MVLALYYYVFVNSQVIFISIRKLYYLPVAPQLIQTEALANKKKS